jgi:sugar lactone lactonase YvrE
MLVVLTIIITSLACSLPFFSQEDTSPDVDPSEPEIEDLVIAEEALGQTSKPDSSFVVGQSSHPAISIDIQVFLEETLGQVLEVVVTNDAETTARLYWTDPGADKIQRAWVGDPEIEDIVTEGLDEPHGIALDVANGEMYWVDAGKDHIRRSTLEGKNVEDLVLDELSLPVGIALNLPAEAMLFTDTEYAKIYSSDLNGEFVQSLPVSMTAPQGLALAPELDRLYWIDTSGIHLTDLTNNSDMLLVPLETQAFAIALDTSGGKMYWTEEGSIQRVNLDGTGIEELIREEPGLFYGIALDTREGMMYWTDSVGGKIRRAELDGDNPEDVIVGLFQPSGLAIELGGDVTVTIPCGLIFTPGTEDGGDPGDPSDPGTQWEGKMQRLMVIQEVKVDVPAGESAKIYPYVSCVDPEGFIPDLEAAYHPVGVASGNLMEMADCICSEKLVDDESDPMLYFGQQATLQTAIYEVAKGQSIDDLMDSLSGTENAIGQYMELQEIYAMMSDILPEFIDWQAYCGVELE